MYVVDVNNDDTKKQLAFTHDDFDDDLPVITGIGNGLATVHEAYSDPTKIRNTFTAKFNDLTKGTKVRTTIMRRKVRIMN